MREPERVPPWQGRAGVLGLFGRELVGGRQRLCAQALLRQLLRWLHDRQPQRCVCSGLQP